MKIQTCISTATILLFCNLTLAGPEDAFYTQIGSEPTFAEVMESGKLPRGTNSQNGFKGTDIQINHSKLENSPNAITQ